MALSDHLELGRQLRQPTGEAGIETGRLMNQSNKAMYEDMFSLIAPQQGQKLLEIGFGNGAFFRNYFAMQPKTTVAGIDFSETMLAEAESTNRDLLDKQLLELRLADAASLPFQDQEFDYVVTINTLYFWPNPAAQLQEIMRVLRPGGEFLLGFRPKAAVKDAPFTKEVFTLYDPEEVNALLQDAGFLISEESDNIVQFTDAAGKPITMPGKTIKAIKPDQK